MKERWWKSPAAGAAGLGLAVAAMALVLIGLYQVAMGPAIAGGKLKDYAKSQRPEQTMGAVSRDKETGLYEAALSDGTVLRYDMKANAIYDAALQGEGQADYAAAVARMPRELTFPEEAVITTQVDAADYTLRQHQLELGTVWNDSDITWQDSKKMPRNIARRLMDEMGADYQFTGIRMTYADRNGMYELVVESDASRALDDAALAEGCREYSVEEARACQAYQDWLASHF